MPKEITLPEQSESTQLAAEKIGAKVAVLVTVNFEENTWEVRCYGATDPMRFMASNIADIVLEALDMSDPPSDWPQALETIRAPAGAGN